LIFLFILKKEKITTTKCVFFSKFSIDPIRKIIFEKKIVTSI